jgi:hypothetical protein
MNQPNSSPSSTPTSSPTSYQPAASPLPPSQSGAPPLPPPLPVQPIGYATPQPPHVPGKSNFAQQAAKASWMAPVIAIILGFLANNSRDRSGSLIMAFANMGLITIGFALGIVALLGIRRHGREGVLGPAIIGLVINGLFLAGFVAILFLARR